MCLPWDLAQRPAHGKSPVVGRGCCPRRDVHERLWLGPPFGGNPEVADSPTHLCISIRSVHPGGGSGLRRLPVDQGGVAGTREGLTMPPSGRAPHPTTKAGGRRCPQLLGRDSCVSTRSHRDHHRLGTPGRAPPSGPSSPLVIDVQQAVPPGPPPGRGPGSGATFATAEVGVQPEGCLDVAAVHHQAVLRHMGSRQTGAQLLTGLCIWAKFSGPTGTEASSMKARSSDWAWQPIEQASGPQG